MSASVSLCLRDNFEKYDGTIKSLMNLNVVVSPDVKRKIKRMGDDGELVRVRRFSHSR